MKNRDQYNDWIVEVMEVERLFCQMAEEKGIKEAFLHFAAKEAVLNRNNTIYAGKAGIEEYYKDQKLTDVTLSWKPDYVDVSQGGDMAWTHGKYQFSGVSEEGKPISAEGIFHTVWKRQSDGAWKYVWD